MLVPLLALALAAPARIAVLPIVAGEGVTEKTASALTESLAAEVRKRSGADVVTQREINAVLSLERQKTMMGCATDSCMAELGGALGVEKLVNGDIARVGESLLVHVRLLEVTRVKVAAQADRRFRKGTLDDVLDALPAMMNELFAGVPAPSQATAQATASSGDLPPDTGAAPGPTPAKPKVLPPPWAEEPASKLKEEEIAALAVWGDGSGNFIATNPAELSDILLSGTARKLHLVRTFGGHIDGSKQTGARSFWDPRVGRRGEFRWSLEAGTLSCASEVPFKRLPAMEAKRLLSRAELLAPRWRRIPHLLARDDQGIYFYVDGKRDARGNDTDPPDFRLYVGRKGAMALIDLQDVIRDSAGLVFVTNGGRLVARQQGQKYAVEWATPTARLALTWLDAADQGPLVYRELGVYAGQDLGTPCDGRF